MKDPVKLDGLLDTASTIYTPPGCKVSKAKYLCVPATASISSAVDRASRKSLTPIPVFGSAVGPEICYRVKCPKPFPADVAVSDALGARTLTELEPDVVCTPASLTPLTACDVCDGQCPADFVCNFFIANNSPTGNELCACFPGVPCRDTGCPSGTSCERLLEDSGSYRRECVSTPGPSCGGADAPACDGACPDGFFCANLSDGVCTCFEFTAHTQCGGWAGPPACAGLCPPDTPICADVAGTCTCVAP
jgi:hypothetical protein